MRSPSTRDDPFLIFISLLISGGMRAATSSLGVLRALFHAGILGNVRYISSTSGQRTHVHMHRARCTVHDLPPMPSSCKPTLSNLDPQARAGLTARSLSAHIPLWRSSSALTFPPSSWTRARSRTSAKRSRPALRRPSWRAGAGLAYYPSAFVRSFTHLSPPT